MRPRNAESNCVNKLPFIDPRPSEQGLRPGCYWVVSPSGVWTKDTRLGFQYGRMAISAAIADRRPILGDVACDMAADHPEQHGMIIGFMSAVEMLMYRTIKHHADRRGPLQSENRQ